MYLRGNELPGCTWQGASMPKPKPKPRARGLAEGLRAARKASRLAMTEVADKLAWSQSTISRIETGLRTASTEEVSALLAVYQFTGPERDMLIELARDVDRPDWLETRGTGRSIQAKVLAQYELEATKIVEVCPSCPPADKKSPHRTVFIDEAALHRRIGEADRLRQLVTVAARPPVEVRVIPFEAGGHPGVKGAYVLLEFPDARPVVRLEHLDSGLFLHRAADVEPYLKATATLDAIALDPRQSARRIEDFL